MKVNDLVVEDCIFAEFHKMSNEIRNLEFPQKYLLLEIGNEVVSLKISDVTRTAFYLKINDDDEGII